MTYTIYARNIEYSNKSYRSIESLLPKQEKLGGLEVRTFTLDTKTRRNELLLELKLLREYL